MEIYIKLVKDNIELKDLKKKIKLNSDIIYTSDDNGNTVSHFCSMYESYDLLFNIIKIYPKIVTYLNNEGKSCIHLINDIKYINKILNFLEKSNQLNELNIIPYDGKTLLIKMLDQYNQYNTDSLNYFNIIAKILSYKINLNIPLENPPLHYYIGNGKSDYKIVSMLLEAGANPNLKNQFGLNSLIIAILENINIDIIKLLLDNRVDINYSGPFDKFFPLNISLIKGYNNITEILLEYKPDLSYQDNNMNTPIHNALMSDKQISENIMKYLISNSNLNISNLKGQTPLYLLMKLNKWNKYALDKLFDKNFDLNLAIFDMNGNDYIYFINSLSNKILYNYINEKCIQTDYKCIEPLRSKIKEKLLQNKNFNNFNKKFDKIEMPIIIDTDHGIFGANILYNIIYLVQILKRYKNVFIPFQYFLPEKYIDQIIKLDNLNLYKSPYGKILFNTIKLWTEYFYEFAPHIIIWRDKNIYYNNRDLKIYIKKSLDSNKIRFIMIKLTLIPSLKINHANIILYDKKNNVAERFEPYGPLNYYIKDSDELDKYIYDILRENIDINILYKNPKDYMGKTKLQLISESDPVNKKLGDPDGFCLAWCFWFLELKLKNPDYETEILIQKTLKKIINTNTDLTTYIRRYAKKLDIIKNDFLREAGFNKDEFYNISYSNQRLVILLDYLSKSFCEMVQERIE